MPSSRTTKPGPEADGDADVAPATTAIAGLRNRLAHAGTQDHPAVRCELRKLEELLLSQLHQAGNKPRRHRSPVSAITS